jgi:hypothetical protein
MPECSLGIITAGNAILIVKLPQIAYNSELTYSFCSGTFRSECYPKISQIAHVVCVHAPDSSIQISGDMIKILPPPLKASKKSAESKKASSSKTSDNDKAKASSSSDPANSNSFSVKASAKSVPKPPLGASKKPEQPAIVSPPKQKVSPKVHVAAAIPKDADSEISDSQKFHVPPPKKKNHGPAKANLAAEAPQLSAEDAYDYEL